MCEPEARPVIWMRDPGQDQIDRRLIAEHVREKGLRPLRRVPFGNSIIETFRFPSPECPCKNITSIAFEGDTPIGFAEGYLFNARNFARVWDLEFAADAISEEAIHAVDSLRRLGDANWRSRAWLYYSSLTLVSPEHRRQGLGLVLEKESLEAARAGGHVVDVILKPWSWEYFVRNEHAPEGSVEVPLSEVLNARAKIAAYWQSRLPFLQVVPTLKDTPEEDKIWLFGRL